MAMTLSKMKATEATVTVTFDEDTVDVGYYPNRFTPALVESATAAASSGDADGTAALLEGLLAWWDVLDDDGERLPTDRETIADMPLQFLMLTIGAIQEGMRPPTSATSGGPSPSRGRRA